VAGQALEDTKKHDAPPEECQQQLQDIQSLLGLVTKKLHTSVVNLEEEQEDLLRFKRKFGASLVRVEVGGPQGWEVPAQIGTFWGQVVESDDDVDMLDAPTKTHDMRLDDALQAMERRPYVTENGERWQLPDGLRDGSSTTAGMLARFMPLVGDSQHINEEAIMCLGEEGEESEQGEEGKEGEDDHTSVFTTSTTATPRRRTRETDLERTEGEQPFAVDDEDDPIDLRNCCWLYFAGDTPDLMKVPLFFCVFLLSFLSFFFLSSCLSFVHGPRRAGRGRRSSP